MYKITFEHEYSAGDAVKIKSIGDVLVNVIVTRIHYVTNGKVCEVFYDLDHSDEGMQLKYGGFSLVKEENIIK